jgi:predicted lactoylglutathione lyase
VQKYPHESLHFSQQRGVETIDLGFMYSRGVSDPDGHQLDFVWMDMSAQAE